MLNNNNGSDPGANEQKVAVVTGGASGIGRCIAEEFRKQGVMDYHTCDGPLLYLGESGHSSPDNKMSPEKRLLLLGCAISCNRML